MANLNVQDVLSGKLLKIKEVTIKELGDVTVKLKQLSTAQVRDFIKKTEAAKEKEDPTEYMRLSAELFILSAVDDDGKQLFDLGQVEQLTNCLPLSVYKELTEETLKHSQLMNESFEEAVKNSEAAPSTDSISA